MRAKMMSMNERNPRSKLRQMKRRYFAATAIVYLVIFFIAYLVCEMLFMILEAAPYTKLAVLLMGLVIDGVVTDYIINTRMKNRWRREAPDILDEIKAPEPAYIPAGPADQASMTQEKPVERKRLRRTQYQELQAEKNNVPDPETKSTKEPAVSSAPVKSEKKGLNGLFHRKGKATVSPKKPAPTSSATPALEAKPTSEDRSAFMKSIDEMDTVEFEDAVIDLENRVVKHDSDDVKENNVRRTNSRSVETKRKDADGSAPFAAQQEKLMEPAVSARSVSQARQSQPERKPRRIPKSPVNTRREEAPESSSSSTWSSIDEMETVGITEAVSRIQEAEAVENVRVADHSASGRRAKKRSHRRRGN